MSDTPTVTLAGQKFYVYAIGTDFKAEAGVYAFMRIGKDDHWEVIYAGETENLKDRLYTNLKQHHRYDCIEREEASYVAVRLVSGGKKARLELEAQLRQQYDPPCNRQ